MAASCYAFFQWSYSILSISFKAHEHGTIPLTPLHHHYIGLKLNLQVEAYSPDIVSYFRGNIVSWFHNFVQLSYLH